MDVPRTKKSNRRKHALIALTALALLSSATAALSRLRAAAPTVERSTVWIDTVKRGQMLRQVQGPGTLVPEQIRWISAVAAARVEQIFIRPGARVDADSVLLELANPDLQLQALEAERQWASAAAELTNLLATQKNQRLGQESLVATIHSDLSDAQRRAEADQELAKRGFLSALEMNQTNGKEIELRGRLEFERKRLAALGEGMAAQVSAQQAQIERLRSIAQFRHQEVEALRVRAGVSGVLQELPLQVGQWIAPGALLAKVAQPEHLKAEIRIAEAQAKDVQIGQNATIDTRNGLVTGHVARVDPSVQAGAVRVDIALDGELPKGARPDLSVEGLIELERIDDVLYLGRPAFGQANSLVGLFRLSGEGEKFAVRTAVQLGRTSVKTVEIRNGLHEGDQVILSDMSHWDSHERIQLQ